MAASNELAAEGDRREGVTRLAERGQEEATRRRRIIGGYRPRGRIGGPRAEGDLVAGGAQSASASARTICPRPSAVGAIGLAISVPTPASR